MLGISARESRAMWLDYIEYIGDILESKVGAMGEELDFSPTVWPVACARNCTRR